MSLLDRERRSLHIDAMRRILLERDHYKLMWERSEADKEGLQKTVQQLKEKK